MLGALCGCEAVTFRRTATELGLTYSALDFEAAFTIDIRWRQGNRSVRPHFQMVRVRAVVSSAEPIDKLTAVIEETEARCPVMNLLLDAKVDLRIEWLRDADGTRQPVPPAPPATELPAAPETASPAYGLPAVPGCGVPGRAARRRDGLKPDPAVPLAVLPSGRRRTGHSCRVPASSACPGSHFAAAWWSGMPFPGVRRVCCAPLVSCLQPARR